MISDMNEPTISTRRLHEGRIINLREDIVHLPNGRDAKREIVEHKGAACLVPVLPDGRIMMVRQFRKPAEAALWELPAGGLEIGEDPQECARRELSEECNLQGDVTPLFECFLAPGYSTELMHGFLALHCTERVGTPDEDENLHIQAFSLDELLAMIDRNEIRDAKTLCGLLAYYRKQN